MKITNVNCVLVTIFQLFSKKLRQNTDYQGAANDVGQRFSIDLWVYNKSVKPAGKEQYSEIPRRYDVPAFKRRIIVLFKVRYMTLTPNSKN